MPTRLLIALAALVLCPLPTKVASAAGPVEVTLADGGQAALPVVVGAAAPERVRAAAAVLAEYLGRISGGDFRVATGDGRSGIAVGRPRDFPNLTLQAPWPADDPARREDYLLRSHGRGLYALGATEPAVEHAVWDLLYRLGHRQFFPGEAWEVVPRRPALSLAVDEHEHPDYLARRIWYGYGPWDYAKEPYERWCSRNRATSGITLSTGHAYDGIIARNKAAFAEHPEFLGLVGGQRKSTKLCISNPELRALVIEDALNQLAKQPTPDSVSVDPSDGLGWCECEHCRAIGSVSDRALTLANAVAAAVNEDGKYPGTLVGMYAYSAHSPPPSIRVHPRVVISVATAFIRGGYTVDELMSGWHKQGATLGVREYYSVSTWDRDLPGRSRGSDVGYVARTVPHFHGQGARFFSSESSDNWGPNGLGYYLAARMLWDTDEADRLDALVSDFLEKSFGEARGPMAEFYRLIDGGGDPLPGDHLIGRMYRLLDEARQQTDDPAVRRRLDDLVLYTRYVELWSDYADARGDERQANFERMIRHAYRMRGTMMVHAKALYRDVDNRDRGVGIPDGATWNVPEPKNPWKSSEPFTRAELDGFVAEGIENRPLRGFEPVTFGADLVPASRLELNEVPTGKMGLYSRGVRTYHTWVADPARPIRLSVSGGRIYQDRGDVTVTLRPAGDEDAEPLQTVLVPPDGRTHELSLRSPLPTGLYTVTVSDGGAGTVAEWPAGQPMTVLSGLDERADFHGRWTLCFYVPKGTQFVGGYASGPGELRDSRDRVAHKFADRPGYFRVPVPPGEDGRLWRFVNCAGQRLLMTVPPSLARSREELLLPADVIERDRPRPE